MKRWVKFYLVFSLIILTVAPMAFAQADDDEDYEWRTWRTRRSEGGFDGFGEFFVMMNMFDDADINALATSMGLEEMNSHAWGMGGLGMGHVGRGWRIGGGGFGCGSMVDGVYTDNSDPENPKTYNRQLMIGMGGGGFIAEYSPFMFGPVNVGVGAMIGGGGMTIEMRQDTGAFTWNDLKEPYTIDPDQASAENSVTEVTQGFFMFRPYATARIHILTWMALDLTAGYHLDTAEIDNWQIDERDIVGNGPDLNFRHPYFQFGLAFGG